MSLGYARKLEEADLDATFKFQDQRNDLPLRLALGAAYKFAGRHAAAELVYGPRGLMIGRDCETGRHGRREVWQFAVATDGIFLV